MRESISPIEVAFRAWPDARLAHVLDDSLPGDLEAEGCLTAEIADRLEALARYAIDCRADAVLFTCSAFGAAIAATAARFPSTPVHKPNDAMIEEAARTGHSVRLLATFAPTLRSMMGEFPLNVAVEPINVPNALAALRAGEGDLHDRHIVSAALTPPRAELVCLAQFSMSRAAAALARATDSIVLTTPDAAVRKLRSALK